MATSDRLEGTAGSGIKGIKLHMNELSSRIKGLNAQAARHEQENDQAKQIYIKSFGRQQGLKDRIAMVEEKLERNAEKLKELTKRVEDKEKFYEESQKFNKSLKVTVPDEGEVLEMEEKVRIHKEIYGKNYERYQEARNTRIGLDQEMEHTEIKSRDALRRVEALKTELEYNQIEEARRAEACKVAIDNAFKYEKACMDLENGLDHVMKRKGEATKTINELEKKVNKTENAKDTLSFERKRMELTIRECLLNLKSQKIN